MRAGGTKPALCCLKRLLSLWMCQSWHAGDGVWWSEGASVHYQVIVPHFRFGVYSYCAQATGRSARLRLLLIEWRDVWRCGKSWPLSCFIVDGATQLGCGGRPGRRETCGHHGLCSGMEGTEPCPSSSSSTTKTFSLTLSEPSGTRAKRFYSDG